MINRDLEDVIRDKFGQGKAIIIIGPRQTGKTTLLKKILSDYDNSITLNCDELYTRDQLENVPLDKLKLIFGNKKIVFIDEAQRVKNIGLTLKLIIDELPGKILLVSGSSSLELANEINEPLTGRKWEYMLYPVSWGEFQKNRGYLEAAGELERRIIYGMYPEVVSNPGDEKEILTQLAGSYLYKDLLSFGGLRKPEILSRLLRALAFQIGSEVSYNELSRTLQVDKNTVANYLNLLEKAFVIFRLQPFSRNLRGEIMTNRKIYFYDTGIRNSIIANFNLLDERKDKGALWENFIISERIKSLDYRRIYHNRFFWRTREKQEIDYIEERDGKLFASEIKWNPDAKAKIPKKFRESYDAEFSVVHRENFAEFLAG